MFTDPRLMLELVAARGTDLRAEAAHDRLVRALRRQASAPDVGGLRATAPARRWWRPGRSAALS
jgi:hypothetical protein